MWQLYQDGLTFNIIANWLCRNADIFSRYVHEYEAAVSAVSVVLNPKSNNAEKNEN